MSDYDYLSPKAKEACEKAMADARKAQSSLAAPATEVDRLQLAVEAAWRLRNYDYRPWAYCGGENECRHGIAEGIECERCDTLLLDEMAKAIYAAKNPPPNEKGQL